MYKTEQTIRKYDGAILTWKLVNDGPAHTSKVKNKTITHWQPKRWVITLVEMRGSTMMRRQLIREQAAAWLK